MVLNKQDTLEDYARFLKGNAQELDALYSDALISVTSFFRNPEAFEVLRRDVFPKLLRERGDEPVRMWVLGCSTGQEAYSLAMSFMEASSKSARGRKLQVFATDLNDALLEKARQGLYAKSLAEDVSPERLRRFFVEEQGGYRVSKTLREMVVFARQNLIDDPPFSRMDLISCRNLLIYLEPDAQRRALPTFHYALRPGGFLFLGVAESVGGFTDLFEPVDKKLRIYAKKAAPTPAFHMPEREPRGEQPARPAGAAPARREPTEDARGELNAQREADRVAVRRFAPPSVLVNAELQVLQFRGPTGAYLEPASGKASFDVLKMARDGLMLPLRAALNKAKTENKTVRKENVRVKRGGKRREISLEVIPLKNLRERCFLIVFEEARAATAEPAEPAADRAPADRRADRSATREASRRVAELEADLAETREYLQSLQEQHEAANEELQAANEEVQSANEELQSINEELETSKEELESANEELTTVNEEMSNRNAELNRHVGDLLNLQASTKLAIVLLAGDLTIRGFSPQAEKQLDLLAGDVGRPIGNVRHGLRFAETDAHGQPCPSDLETFIGNAISEVRERECEASDKQGRWFSLRVRPYFTVDNKLDGAVLVMIDIDDLKRTERAIGQARDHAKAIVDTVPDPLLVLDGDLRVRTANEAYYRLFQTAQAETEGRLLYDMGEGQWKLPKLRQMLEDILPRNSFFNSFEVTREFGELGRRTLLLNARTLAGVGDVGAGIGDEPAGILLGMQDITELLHYQAAVRRSEVRFRRLFEAARDGVLIIDPGTRRVVDANPFMTELLGRGRDELLGKRLFEIGLLEDEAAGHEAFSELRRHGVLRRDDVLLGNSAPERRHVELICNLYDEDGEQVVQCNIRDVTERKRADAALARSERSSREAGERFRFLAESMPQKLFTADPTGEVDYFNPQWTEYTGLAFDEIKGWGWTRFIHPDDVDENVRVWRRSINTGEPFDFTHRFRSAGGEYRWHLSRAMPFRDDTGRIAMWVGSNTDVHEQLQTAEQLRRYAAELSEADQRKNEFLAMLAHELRNPLAPLRNSLQVLRLTHSDAKRTASAGAEASQAGHAVDMMERQVGQMVRLVDDLLDVSRVSRGKIELRKERVELTAAVKDVVEAAGPLAHELIVELPSVLVYVEADPVRLAQIVSNLLNNALKFTAHGGRIWLTVETPVETGNDDRPAESGEPSAAGEALATRHAPHDTSSPHASPPPSVFIRVRDTGIGIGAEQLRHVFDLFMQVDTSLERSLGGLGIGLALVKNLVEMHGGAIEAHSAGVGQGSEFVVRLPVAGDAPQRPAPLNASATQAAARRILVVDDNVDAATSLALLLRMSGHETRAAHDGLAAVQAAEAFQPDVMLLDIGLPNLNGFEVCRRIRQQPWGRSVVLIALTGWGQDDDRKKSRDAGFDGHLVKPVDFANLQAEVARLTTLTGRPSSGKS